MQRAGLDFELEGGPGSRGAEITGGMFLTQMGIGGYAALDNFGVTQIDEVRCVPQLPLSPRVTCVFFLFSSQPSYSAPPSPFRGELNGSRRLTPPLPTLSALFGQPTRLPRCFRSERSSRRWRLSTPARGTIAPADFHHTHTTTTTTTANPKGVKQSCCAAFCRVFDTSPV